MASFIRSVSSKIRPFLTSALSPRVTPLALLVLCVISFAPLIPWLGVYWDDWEVLLVQEQFGTAGFTPYFAGERPLAGITYWIFNSIAGSSPLAWHILCLGMRWLAAACFYWLCVALFPRQKPSCAIAALIFTVHPLFLWQPVAISFHQHWTCFILFFASLLAMIRSAKPGISTLQRILLVISALAAEGLHLATLEYFVGVELLRPLILWLALEASIPERRLRLRRAVLGSVPYLALLGAFFAWRVGYALQNPDSANRPELLAALSSMPLQTLMSLLRMAVQDLTHILVSIWYPTLQPALFESFQPFHLLAWALALTCGAGCAAFLVRIVRDAPVDPPTSSGRMALLGFLGILLGVAPIWATGRQAQGGLYAERFAMVSILGVALLIAAALEWLTPQQTRRSLLAGFLITLAVGIQLRTANDYRWSWTTQLRVYWQLFQRAPAIQPHTALLTDGDLFNYVRPTFSFNLLYGQPENPSDFPLWHFLLNRGLTSDLDALYGGRKLEEEHRNFAFHGNSRDSLVLYYRPPDTNCLWVLGPEDADDPIISNATRLALPVSSLERIQGQAAPGIPPAHIFGLAPTGDWCTYYEKAALAVQNQDYHTAAALGDEARAAGFSPASSSSDAPHEWLPFIIAYAQSGRFNDATELTTASLKQDSRYKPVFCRVWKTIPGSESLRRDLKCSPS